MGVPPEVLAAAALRNRFLPHPAACRGFCRPLSVEAIGCDTIPTLANISITMFAKTRSNVITH